MKIEKEKEKRINISSSLVATVRKERPDLLGGVDSKGALPLSQDPPQYVMDKWNYGIEREGWGEGRDGGVEEEEEKGVSKKFN